MGMIGFQSQCAVRRLMPGGAVRRHIARAERLNSVARSAGRLPRPRDVVTRSRTGLLTRLQRVSYGCAPAIQENGCGRRCLILVAAGVIAGTSLGARHGWKC